jgi:NAD(P)-dependent dehydrogenase (short-subunit alcohol dehydrogenase family)
MAAEPLEVGAGYHRSTAVITGSGRGLGRAIVDELIARGCPRVVATARSLDGATALRSLAERDERVVLHELDVTSGPSIERFAASMYADGRPIDVLVNNAGIGFDDHTIMSMPIENLRRQLETHAIGPLQVVRAVTGLLRRGSVIVNVSSVVSGMHRIGASYAGYAQAKALQNAITRALARTLEADGVIVFALHPGWVATDMSGPGAPLQPEDVARGMVDLMLSSTLADTDTFRDHTGARAAW